jgi:hypothetical protein
MMEELFLEMTDQIQMGWYCESDRRAKLAKG